LSSGQVDLIAGDATAGLISALDLVQLETAATISRCTTPLGWRERRTLLKYPQVRIALERLGGRVTAADMRA